MKTRAPPLANIITLGVRNFDAQRDFYRRLGWPQAFDSDDFAVFELRGALLALFSVDKLAACLADAGGQLVDVLGFLDTDDDAEPDPAAT